jgi:DNA-directed RNA polymerase specialized sigma24 family protein
MTVSDYEGIADWKVRLAIRLAKARGFKRQDLEDAVQSLLTTELNFQFDPARAAGRTEEETLAGLFVRRLIDIRRKKSRRREVDGSIPALERASTSDAVDIEVQIALKSLRGTDRQICDGLFLGMSINEIAGALGCSWYTVQQRIQILRHVFDSAGLGRQDGSCSVFNAAHRVDNSDCRIDPEPITGRLNHGGRVA